MPDIRRAINIPSMPSKMNRQTLMFSATFPSEIQRLAGEFLNNYLHLQVMWIHIYIVNNFTYFNLAISRLD